MTEKQIEQLKRVLSGSSVYDSELTDHSSQIDALILTAARETAETNRAKARAKASLLRTRARWSFSLLRSASLALVFTIGVFLVMGQMIKVNEPLVGTGAFEMKIDSTSGSKDISSSGQAAIEIPDHPAREPEPSRLSRDQILLNFDLAETQQLLTKLSLDFNRNSGSDHSELDAATVQLAMVDISSLIKTGELDDARQRYSELKTECDDCGLPETLEALVIVLQSFSNQPINSKTG